MARDPVAPPETSPDRRSGSPSRPTIAGVILAGGRSRRMGGGDKCLRPLRGETLISHVVARARPQVDALAINANGDPERFSDFALPVVGDSVEAKAQVAELVEAMGLEAIDLGPLHYARHVEGMLIVWINARRTGQSFDYHLRKN